MKLFFNFIFFCLAGYAVVLAALYFFQEKFLFFPGATPFGDCPGMEKRDANAQVFGTVRYYLQTKSEPENWIIIFHGNAGNACDRTYFLDLLNELNSNLVILEYPGFGKDSNSPGEALILKQSLDLVLHIKGMNHRGLPVYLMGESLGTGVATWVCAQTDISGLILISAYTSILDVARHHYPWAPVTILMRHKFQADVWAGETDTPALLFHGVNDTIIPVHFARQQSLNFKGIKTLFELPDCGHNDMVDAHEKTIRQRIREFIYRQP